MILENHTAAYLTNWGAAYCGDSLDLLAALPVAFCAGLFWPIYLIARPLLMSR